MAAEDGCAVVCCTIGFGVFALWAGWNLANKNVRAEAVKHGAAHWVVADDGTTTFAWNEPVPCAFEQMQMKSIEGAAKDAGEAAVRKMLEESK
jgi:TRAP-type C4-dicarboxylate transport system permease small subunit